MSFPGWVRRFVSIGLRILVGAVLLAIIFARTDPRAVGAAARQIAPGFALLAVGVMLLVGLVTAGKWWVLLRALAIEVRLREVIRLTYIAVTWNLALPGGESGNLVKAALLARRQPAQAGPIWASMLVDQFSLSGAQLLVALVTLSLASFPPFGVKIWLLGIGLGIVLVLALYAAFLVPVAPARVDAFLGRVSRALAIPAWLRRRVAPQDAPSATELEARETSVAGGVTYQPGEWLAPIWRGLTNFRGHGSALLLAVGIAVLYYATIFLAYWLAALGLGLPFGYPDIAWVTALAGIASLLPITIAGAGVREGIIVFFLAQRGVSTSTALTFSLAVLALNIILGLPGLWIQIFRRPVT